MTKKEVKKLQKDYRESSGQFKDIDTDLQEFIIINHYYDGDKKTRKYISETFGLWTWFVNAVDDEKQIKSLRKKGADEDIDIYDLNKVNHIRKNYKDFHDTLDVIGQNIKIESNKLLKELDTITGFNFYYNGKIYIKIKDIDSDIRVLKKGNNLVLEIFTDEWRHQGMFYSGCGCNLEETLDESDVEIIEDEILEEEKITSLQALIADFENEGEIYNFLLKNYDTITASTYDIQVKRGMIDNFNYSILINAIQEKTIKLLESFELNKTYKIKTDDDEYIIIKKTHEDNLFDVFSEIDNRLQLIHTQEYMSSLISQKYLTLK